jgi:phosphate-selective porin OprO/OprP
MRTVPTALAALAVLAAPSLRADEPQAGPPAPQQAVPKPAEQEGEKAPAKAADKPAEKKTPPVSAGSDGFSIQNESGDFRVQLRGYAQLDGRFFTGDEGALGIDTFLLRRARPIVAGSLGRFFEFSVMPDFGGGVTVLQDAYLDFKPSPKLKFRFGKYKSPVGLERLQSATAIHFVERAFPTAIVPNRDVGVMVFGDLAGGVVSYAGAVLDGAPDGGSVDGDTNDGKDLAGRLFLSPFKRGSSFFKDLGFGIAGTTGKQTGPLPAYRSTGQVSVITLLTGITADGTRTRYSPQLSVYSGRFGLLAEYAKSSSKVKKADGTRFDLDASAWEVTTTIALTGDKASYAGLRPVKPFDPSKGQWGALELTARVHELELDRGAVDAGAIDPAKSARKLTAWGVGLTWSLTRNVKQVADFEHVSFKGGASSGDRESENVVFIRTQFSF